MGWATVRRVALTAAPALAAAALLAGCGGGDGGDGGGDGPSERGGAAREPDVQQGPEEQGAEDGSAPGRPGAGRSGGPSGETSGGPSGETSGETEPVPDTAAPPEGDFTAEERDFLTGRVPEGADPAAVLETGTAACDRLGYLARHDRDTAVAALRDGDIPQAEAAVESLCPHHADLLAEAQGETS